MNDCPTSVRSRLTRLLYEGKFSSFFEAASNREKLLLRVGTEVGARAAVGCVPSSYFKTTIPADRFKRLLCRCLALNSVSIPPKCSHCDDILDPFGDHSVSCYHDGLRTRKHNNLRDHMEKFCSLAGLQCQKELFRLVTNGWQRPADLRVSNWDTGRDAWFDVSVINTHASSYFDLGLREHMGALNDREKEKYTDAKDTAEALGVSYKPIIFTC